MQYVLIHGDLRYLWARASTNLPGLPERGSRGHDYLTGLEYLVTHGAPVMPPATRFASVGSPSTRVRVFLPRLMLFMTRKMFGMLPLP